MDKLTLSDKDVFTFYNKNGYAMLMLGNATDDYMSARCLMLNFLFRGLGLASEAIEKTLKAMLFLETGTIDYWKSWHKPYELKEKLKDINPKWGCLDRFDNLLKKLFGHYQHRYHDNNSSQRQSGDELNEIDELWCFLWEKLSVPDEVKYKHYFYSFLFARDFKDDKTRKVTSQVEDIWYECLICNNASLQSQLPTLKRRYSEVRKHLYPDLVP